MLVILKRLNGRDHSELYSLGCATHTNVVRDFPQGNGLASGLVCLGADKNRV